MPQTLIGKKSTWQLSDRPIGAGDAGEVFAVHCVEDPDRIGVLKKPAQVATGGTLQRQATQIAQESRALSHLAGLPKGKAHPPKLLDQAEDLTRGTANYFIVTEQASGEDLSVILQKTRQAHIPFPRRVIIAVLDALFDLFSRAHKRGVLWNDVKLDHIFWEHATGHITIIDWGNARFLEESNPNATISLERWEDYHQMIQTLGGFLKDQAPELYLDLGWESFETASLDRATISILARRIAYQQDVINLKIMEYQALMRVVTSMPPSLEGMKAIKKNMTQLRLMGAPWDQEACMAYARALVDSAVEDKDIQTCIKATALVWDTFSDDLSLEWHLLREYLRHPDILTHAALTPLVVQTLNQKWSNALWHLVTIATQSTNPLWWEQLIPVLRQKALGLVTPLPRQSCVTLLNTLERQPDSVNTAVLALDSAIQNWRLKGKISGTSPFEYEIVSLLDSIPNAPPRTKQTIKKIFAAGKEAIRAILQNWVNMDWEAMPKAFRRLIGWDPDRWGLLNIYQMLMDFQSWLNSLYEGPITTEAGSAFDFLAQAYQERPEIENYLGTPPWLTALIVFLQAVTDHDRLDHFKPEIKTWCPWFLDHLQVHPTTSSDQIDNKAEEAIENFYLKLRGQKEITSALEAVRKSAPESFTQCQQMAQAFDSLLDPNLKAIEPDSHLRADTTGAFSESLIIYKTLLSWRKALREGSLERAYQALQVETPQGWALITAARQCTIRWKDIIGPALTKIQAVEPFDIPEKIQNDLTHSLNIILSHQKAWSELWEKILRIMNHPPLFTRLESRIEEARRQFLDWQQINEKSTHPIDRVIYKSQIAIIDEISNMLLELSIHSRQARMDHLRLNAETETLGNPFTTAKSFLSHMMVIEKYLVHPKDQRRFPGWVRNLETVMQIQDPSQRREAVIQMDNSHPLYPWLIEVTRSTLQQN